ncbi:neural Wiskott-Aldrich syndrome protein-like isoform X2 [Varroa jacobsoni]|uniref:neural Wiskott-Aldrich syndrome protein-like isoform X2 n=1 Tax=Varroa jacobsoni TaxID=62625 RepID=UPI000BF66C6F|nr:neural Wiskott-Aldrich syndrome protein-like isoform X2 [Varroa jacobsoni]
MTLRAHPLKIKAAGVVQLYCSSPSVQGGRHDHWRLLKVGVACFIKDNSACGFFIRLFDIKERQFCWEQELFTQFKYEARMPYFHEFEADFCMAGLNFSNEDEARLFKQAVDHKITMRRVKLEERKRQAAQGARGSRGDPSVLNNNHSNNNNNHLGHINNNNNHFATIGVKGPKSHKSSDKKRKITKKDIGMPTDFVHVRHVGLDTAINDETLSDLNLLDLDRVYEQAGISRDQVENNPYIQQEVRRVMRQQVDSNMLSETTISAIHRRQPPVPPIRTDPKPVPPLPPSAPNHQPPSRQLPPVPPHGGRSPAPPKPHRLTTGSHTHKPPPPVPPPHQQQQQQQHRGASMQPVQPVRLSPPAPPPPPPAPGGASPGGAVLPPPPPPPPPPMTSPPAPPMSKLNGTTIPSSNGMSTPSTGNGGGGATGGRDALLEQIRAGKILKRVEVSDTPAANSVSSVSEGRDALLEQIRAGKTLKPVADRPQRPEVPRNASNNQKVEKELDGLAEALKKAIQIRNDALQSDDSDDSTCEALDDDEWDD